MLQCFIPLAVLSCGAPDMSNAMLAMRCTSQGARAAQIKCASPQALPATAQSMGYGMTFCIVENEAALGRIPAREGWVCSEAHTSSELPKSQPSPAPPADPEPKQTQPTAKPADGQAVKVWKADWGNAIVAFVTDEPCSDDEFVGQGYQFHMVSTIPVERLKDTDDAWLVQEGRAATVAGCWFKKADGLIHLKMRRKKDGRIFEEDRNLGDGSWTAVE